MPHETENPLIIDVVGEVESPQSAEKSDSKKAGRTPAKKGFFKKEKARADAAMPQNAPETEVGAAVPTASTVPTARTSAIPDIPLQEEPVRSEQPVQPCPPTQQTVRFQSQTVSQQPAQAQQPEASRAVPGQASQAASAQSVQQVQPTAGFAAVPVGSSVQQDGMVAAAASPRKGGVFLVFGILAVLVVVFALAAMGLFLFYQFDSNAPLAPTSQVNQGSDEVKPIVSASLDQASKVSLRATAENWNENDSTPVIAYIKCVEDAPDSTDESSERYFAFAPNQNASISLPAGRYAFNFIVPMNADGSLYAVPEMVNMVVGDGGMAVLPVDFTLVPKEEATEDQVSRALAQLKTALEKGDESFDYEPFKKSIDLALNAWFPQSDVTTEKPATDLTQEQNDALNAQADSQNAEQTGNDSSNSSTAEHAHDWVAQHEQRWQPAIVPVIDVAAWESPVYARYRCQEGILFETLDACLSHVRERGNEPYTTSNEIIRIDYHPAVVHYEEQGSYEDVITGYRCSICGVQATL